MVAQPRRAAELDRMRDLVNGHPQDELVTVDPEVASGLREIGGEQEEPRGNRSVEQREVVLTEHALREDARQRPHLGAEQQSRCGAERSGKRSRSLAKAVGQEPEQGAHAAQVRGDPARPVDGLERRQLRRKRKTAVLADAPCEVICEWLYRVGVHTAIGRRAGYQLPDSLGCAPVDGVHTVSVARRGRASPRSRRRAAAARRRRRACARILLGRGSLTDRVSPAGRTRPRGDRRGRRSSLARRCATCLRGCGCCSTRRTPPPWCARWPARRSSCARSISRG